ncbi:CRISPR system precrRNA processing endoribonuclease RAMP protein Cas6 [Campylobacter sp.]|uniref:CRISPR system precrRNA processing endoribonuclease RAMP protein Cas6 n=1 Tax=Campylobacter sp. TaxID=205 RepID=UPI0027012D2B|nr:CRISPR system precrRNA processing endoribonuclease RAMP protein Cas6 [Campylobacter sp.]
MIKYLTIGVNGISIKPAHAFIGSTIRGVFGRGLRRVACPYIDASCDSCRYFNECIYAEFFENVSKAPKFILDIDFNSHSFDFKILLFEHATLYLPHVIIAIENMCQIGLGMPSKTFYFKNLTINGKMISFKESVNPSEHILDFSPSFSYGDYKITALTPIRIKQKNGYVRSKLDFKSFIRQIAMRFGELTDTNIEKFEVKFDKFEQNFKFYDLERYSNRQRTKMEFGGIMGDMRVYGLDERSAGLLELATLINVGKSTAFGLGKIKVERI